MNKAIIFYPHIGEYGGIERNILGLAAEIKQKKLVPLLLCHYDHLGMRKYEPALEVVELGDHWNPFTKGARVRKWLQAHQDKIKGLPLFFGDKAGFYAATGGYKPYVLHYTDPPSLVVSLKKTSKIKNLVLSPKRRISNGLTQKGVHNADVLLTMTQWNAAELESIYHRRFEVIYQGGVPPEAPPNAAPRCQGSSLRLFSICRLADNKNLHWILEAARQLKTTEPFTSWYPQIEVVIAGTGPEAAALKQAAEKLQLESIVRFPGFLDAAQVEEEYRRADLFLVPGRQGFGLPALEALYRRVPVVINKESRISEMFEAHPWVGVSANSSESFSQAVRQQIKQLRVKSPDAQRLEKLPTEQEWAIQIGRRCLWW